MKRFLITVIAVAGLLIVVFFALKKIFFSKDQRLLEVEQEVRELRQQKTSLSKEIADSQERSFVEREARERLNMAYPGETVVVLPHSNDHESGPPTSPTMMQAHLDAQRGGEAGVTNYEPGKKQVWAQWVELLR